MKKNKKKQNKNWRSKDLIKSDIDLIKTICSLTEMDLLFTLDDMLEKYGYRDKVLTEDYLIAEGKSPICLVAHCDTVFSCPPEEFFYDQEKSVLWSPDGAGFDDRAGIFIILKILQKGYRPSLIFTNGEEMGCVGSFALTARYKKAPFREIHKPKFMVQLDRMGKDDCVFYDCVNKDFIKTISSFGFKVRKGSFSDISVLAPTWGIAAVNLSVGYYDEHTTVERLFIKQTYRTLDKVMEILDKVDTFPEFKYVGKKSNIELRNLFLSEYNDKCYWCNKKTNGSFKYHLPGVGDVPLCDACAEFIQT